MSVLLPSEIVNTGVIKESMWIAGVIVRVRERNLDANASQKGGGKAKVGKQKKEMSARRGLELHLNGGATPAEVIMVESWDGETTKRLRNMAQMESAMRFSKVIIKRHTEKSKSWTTSRLPFFIEVLASSVFEVTNANPLWQVYHPLTPFADLHHLTSGQLVCIAGRIIEPTPEKKLSESDRRMSR